MYTVSETAAAEKELRSLDGNGNVDLWGREAGREDGDQKCLEEAVSHIEANRMMEGQLQFQGKWRVGFLVYMVD